MGVPGPVRACVVWVRELPVVAERFPPGLRPCALLRRFARSQLPHRLSMLQNMERPSARRSRQSGSVASVSILPRQIESFLSRSRHAPPRSLTRFAGCVMGGFPPPPVARLPRALLSRLGGIRRAGNPTPTRNAAPRDRQAGHLRRLKSWGGSAAGAGRKPCPALRAWHPIAGRLARPAVAAKEKYQEALSR